MCRPMTYKTNKMLHLICNVKQNKAFFNMYTRARTHTDCRQATTQALRASAGKFTWGRVSTVQVGLCHVPV